MNKALYIPIIALVILLAQRILHFEFTSQEVQIIQDGLLAIIVLLGIFTDPKKGE